MLVAMTTLRIPAANEDHTMVNQDYEPKRQQHGNYLEGAGIRRSDLLWTAKNAVVLVATLNAMQTPQASHIGPEFRSSRA